MILKDIQSNNERNNTGSRIIKAKATSTKQACVKYAQQDMSTRTPVSDYRV